MIEFVYTRLEPAYSPHGWDGWQFVGDVPPERWDEIEAGMNPPRDRTVIFGIRVGEDYIVGKSTPVVNGLKCFAEVHDSSRRDGVFIAHGIIIPAATLRSCWGNWRNLARSVSWITSTTELIQRYRLGDGRLPEPESWMRRTCVNTSPTN